MQALAWLIYEHSDAYFLVKLNSALYCLSFSVCVALFDCAYLFFCICLLFVFYLWDCPCLHYVIHEKDNPLGACNVSTETVVKMSVSVMSIASSPESTVQSELYPRMATSVSTFLRLQEEGSNYAVSFPPSFLLASFTTSFAPPPLAFFSSTILQRPSSSSPSTSFLPLCASLGTSTQNQPTWKVY